LLQIFSFGYVARKYKRMKPADVVICDEAHKLFDTYAETDFRQGYGKLLGPDTKTVCLSGTLHFSKTSQIYTALKLANSKVFAAVTENQFFRL
jgi:hypothetical protein